MINLVELQQKVDWLVELADFTVTDKGSDLRKIMATYIRKTFDDHLCDVKDAAIDMLQKLDEYDADGLDSNL